MVLRQIRLGIGVYSKKANLNINGPREQTSSTWLCDKESVMETKAKLGAKAIGRRGLKNIACLSACCPIGSSGLTSAKTISAKAVGVYSVYLIDAFSRREHCLYRHKARFGQYPDRHDSNIETLVPGPGQRQMAMP